MIKDKKNYDLIVIGAGPAGLMAASVASKYSKNILVIEKNPSPGVKLLMTGNGRSNITNYIEDPKELIKYYGSSGKFLYSSFYNFSPVDTIKFFDELGVPTKIEKGNKVFPESDKSRDILNALVKDIEKNGVVIKGNCIVNGFKSNGSKITKLVLEDGQELMAKNFLIATGGLSIPASGSSGDGFRWAKLLGHNITNLHPALVPINCSERFIKKIEGVSMQNLKVKLFKSAKMVASDTGDVVFTADGISGPLILNLSLNIDKGYSGYSLSLDFFPDWDETEFEEKIITEFSKNNNKKIKNCLDGFLPKKIATLLLDLIKIDKEKQINIMRKEERKMVIKMLKDFKLTIKGTPGYEKAMVTRGGIDLSEVDPKTMKSKIISNLFFAGEVLDLHGPTGGFNLQIAWSTGYSAGQAAVKNLN